MYEGDKPLRSVFADTMLEIGLADSKLAVLVGDISHYALQPFAAACPGRYYNVGICEQCIVSMAAGLSHVGFRPVVHTIAPFIVERAFEQIKLDFCYQELGGNLISVGSAFDYTALGCSHYCYDDFSLIKSLPRTQVIYPAMPNEFKILFSQTYANDLLTYFRLPGTRHEMEIRDSDISLGKAVVIREGHDCTIVVTGPQLKNAAAAAEVLSVSGINSEIIYIHTIKPFDVECVRNSIGKTQKYLVVEEHSMYGGLGDETIRACAGLESCKGTFINIPDKFLHAYGTYKEHCEHYGFTAGNIVREIKKMFKG
ncbi:MAG: hypothetical protein A2020_07425 [Lentisphaerae bacterium GWF2_45_14]|nr:MAG: hypothetical protein A2020_07425 [Lentisphaerae bacterium GWF2_45_14]